MKNHHRINTVIFLCMWLLSYSCFSHNNVKKTLLIISDPNSSVHISYINEFKHQISNYESFSLIYENSNTIKLSNYNTTDYIISIGTTSANKVLKHKPKAAVLFTFIPDQLIYNSISKRNNTNYYSISITQPAFRVLRLSELISHNRKIGLTLGPKTSNYINEFKKLAPSLNAELVIKDYKNFSEPTDAMRESLRESSLYIATYDSEILNRHSSKWLLYMAYKMNRPVIGYSNAYTKSGAVASLFSTPQQFAKQGAKWLIDMTVGTKMKRNTYPKYFTVSINKRVQHVLRMKNVTADWVELKLVEMEREPGDENQ